MQEVVVRGQRPQTSILSGSIGFLATPWLANPDDDMRNPPKRTDEARTFSEMYYNAVHLQSRKTIIKGQLREKLRKDPALEAWKKSIIAKYKADPKLTHHFTQLKLGGVPFFSVTVTLKLNSALEVHK